MFEQELQKIKAALKDTSDIELNNEYDALLVKPLASSNLLHENRNFSKTKQSHIALSGKASQDFFPYVDIYHYTDTELNDQSMKSFYVLQVPVSLNKKILITLMMEIWTLILTWTVLKRRRVLLN